MDFRGLDTSVLTIDDLKNKIRHLEGSARTMQLVLERTQKENVDLETENEYLRFQNARLYNGES